MLIGEPICFKCKHFDVEAGRCPAFPGEDIPDDIMHGISDHSEPLEEQKNNIVFEAVED